MPVHSNLARTKRKKLQEQIDRLKADYGTCSTAAATAAKTVACAGFVLTADAEITVKFTVTNTAPNPTLNVNGTGAKPVYYRGSAINAGYLAAKRTYTFRYNGTQYDLVGDIDTNTTYNTGTASDAGLAKLYTGTGTNTDGTMTQKAITSAMNDLVIIETANLFSGFNSNWGEIAAKEGYDLLNIRSSRRVINDTVFITGFFGEKNGVITFVLNGNCDSSIEIPAILTWVKTN